MHGQIIVANVDNESMLGDIGAVPPIVFESTAIISFRLLWLARPGDVVILPRVPPRLLLEYIEKITGIDFSSIKFIVPSEIAMRRASITGSVLLSDEVLTAVKEALRDLTASSWQLLPYYYTTAIGQFGREIAKNFPLVQAPFNAEGGAEILNQKTIFRKLAAGINVPFAVGEIVEGSHELQRAVSNLIPFTGTVIIKQDKSGGGEGNYVITSTDLSYFKGVSKALSLSHSSLEEASRLVVAELATKGNEALAVEVYYDTSLVVYSEYFICDNGSVDYLNHGIMRMLPLWSGFEIPGHIQPKAQADFIHNSTKLAVLARSFGYSGHLNIDAIITTDGDVIFTEINGRTGGCTHVHAVSQYLLGSNYLNTHQVSTYNKSSVRDFQDYLDLLTENELHFSEREGKGVVVLSSDQREHGTALELMFIGSDLDEVLEIESVARMLAETIRN